MSRFRAGVLYGKEVEEVYAYAKDNNFALPAVNCVGTDSVNAVIEAAAKVNSPVILQFSSGGAQFYAGTGLNMEGKDAEVAVAIAGAQHGHLMDVR